MHFLFYQTPHIFTMSSFSFAISLVKQSITECAENKKKQILCDAICHIKNAIKKEIVDENEAKCLLGYCYKKLGYIEKAIQTMELIDSAYLCADIQFVYCWIAEYDFKKAEKCLENCNKLVKNKYKQTYASAVHFAFAQLYKHHEYNDEMEMTKYVECLNSLKFQKEKSNDNLYFLTMVNENDVLFEMEGIMPCRKRYLFYETHDMQIPKHDVAVLRLDEKHAIVTTCKQCDEQNVVCKPYGYKCYYCKPCRKELQKELSKTDCYDMCVKLHPELKYPKYSNIVEYKERSTENLDLEIIYAGLRKNKKLFHQIKCFGNTWQTFEEYEKECYGWMICQMFCLIGYYYDECKERDLEISALKLSTKYGKMIKNYGVLVKVNIYMHNYQQTINDYCYILDDDYLGTSSYILHQFAYCYSKLDDFDNATKCNKMALLQNGRCISDYSIKDALVAVSRNDGIKSLDDLVLQYFNSGKITHLQCIKQAFKQHYLFWKILERSTNRHRDVKKELENMQNIEKLKTDECVICYENCNKMMPMNCGHWVCEVCMPKLKGKCIYRCKTKN